nr:VaFE repeat-containing surface-anchored protein [Lachnospiraceae bacterium]
MQFTAEDGAVTTWTFQTDADGFVYYRNSYKISGPALLTDGSGKPGFPAGTLTVKETKAPAGYALDPAVYTVHFTVGADGYIHADRGTWNQENEAEDLEIISAEQPKKIALSLTKKGTGDIPPGTSLNGIRFAVINNSAGKVSVGGTDYAPGRVTEILTISGASGNTASLATGRHYPAGSYTICELRRDATIAAGEKYEGSGKLGTSPLANDHFLWAENKLSVTVTAADAEAGTAKAAGTASDAPAEKYLQASVKKVDDTDKPVEGVVFNLIYDGTDHRAVTDARGIAVWTGIPWAKNGKTARLIEVSVPDEHYQIDPAYQAPDGKSFTITGDPDTVFDLGTVVNGRTGTVTLKKADEKGRAVQGVVFNLKYDGADHEQTTDAQGRITWTEIRSGTAARLIEVSVPDGKYAIDPVYTGDGKAITVTLDEAFTYDLGEIVNHSLVSAGLKKTDDAGTPLAGVRFNLRYDGTDHEKTTDDRGEIVWPDIPSGTEATLTETYVPAGYWPDKTYAAPGLPLTITGEAGTTYDLGTVVNTVQRGSVTVEKHVVTADGAPEPGISPAGFLFRLTGRSLLGEAVDMTAVTGEDGCAVFADVPFSDTDGYTVTEELTAEQASHFRSGSIAPNPVILDTAHEDVTVTAENIFLRGGISLTKHDACTGPVPQGDASFAGIRFAVINRSEEAVPLPDGTQIPSGAVALVLTADETGRASSSAHALALGTYEVTELRLDDTALTGQELVRGTHEMANDSYLWRDTHFTVTLAEEGLIVEACGPDGEVFENKPAEPEPPQLLKYDVDLGTNRPQGAADLAGIRFALINRSAGPVYVRALGKAAGPGQVIDILTSGVDGVIGLSYLLPYGTYGLAELPLTTSVKPGDLFDDLSDADKYGAGSDRFGQLYANDYYLYTDREEKLFRAVTGEDRQPAYDTELLHFDNKLIRGGFYFEKKVESTQQHLPCLLFRLTLKETGESHYIFLNPNAFYGTDQLYNPHSNNTNGIDALLEPYADAAVIPQSVIDELTAQEAWTWGTWFGDAPVNDADLALPCGTYELEELRSPANENYFMFRYDELRIWYGGQYHSFGTIFNKEAGILTEAADAVSGTHEGIARENAVILDEVTCTGLVPGREYRLTATLMLRSDDGTGTPVPGVRADKTFTAGAALWRETVEIPFNAAPYADRSITVFEELRETDTDTVIAEHKSLNDPGQTVTYRPAPLSAIAIIKEETSSPANGIAYVPGETVTYRITVTNPGETDLRGVRVTDEKTGLDEVIALLRAGGSQEFITSHTVTEEDAKEDTYENVAVAEAEDPYDPGTILRAEDPETVPVMTYAPDYIQNKKVLNAPANGTAFVSGETVLFGLYLNNTGNQPLTVTVRDDLVGLTETVELPVGGEWEKTVSYTVTEADAQRGSVRNVLTSEGRTPGRPEEPIIPPPAEAEVPTMIPEPKLWIDKAVTGSTHITARTSSISEDGEIHRHVSVTPFRPGETVPYSILVGNSGNMDLREIEVTDEQTGFRTVIDILRPGETREFFTSHVITPEDAEAGEFLNTATARAKNPNAAHDPDLPELTAEDDERVPAFAATPSLLTAKEVLSRPANGTAYTEGETVRYRLTVTNDGNVDLTGVTIDDALVGLHLVLESLKTGETWTRDVTYTVTREDADAGSILNVLTVTATDPEDPETPVTPPEKKVEVPTVPTVTPAPPVPPMGDTESLIPYAAVFLAGLGGLFLLLPRRKRSTPC